MEFSYVIIISERKKMDQNGYIDFRILKSRFVGDYFKMSVTVLTIFVTFILFFYISDGHKHSKDVTKIEIQSPNRHQI